MFAVVAINGKQYTVAKGDIVLVERLEGEVGETVTFDHVLLTNADGKTHVGTPAVRGVSVKAKILAHEKGEKLEVRRFKAKVRTRRKTGFRPQLTKLQVVSIGNP